MCVSIPVRICQITPGALPMARVEVAGQAQDCCLAYVPQAQVGDYVLVQNGFAIELLDPQSAAESLAAFAALGVIAASDAQVGVPATLSGVSSSRADALGARGGAQPTAPGQTGAGQTGPGQAQHAQAAHAHAGQPGPARD